jgi:hypothetical protein
LRRASTDGCAAKELGELLDAEGDGNAKSLRDEQVWIGNQQPWWKQAIETVTISCCAYWQLFAEGSSSNSVHNPDKAYE